MNGASAAARMFAVVLFALMAGFFYAFSVAIMAGLDRVAAATAIEAMNGINATVRNPVFFVTFFGPPFAALAAATLAMMQGDRPAGWTLGAAALLYMMGVIAPTAAVNVPMNEALALNAPADTATQVETIWSDYSVRWTRWNTMRGLVCTGCLVLAALSLTPWRRQRVQP